MKVPNYIRTKMHQIAKHAQAIGKLESDVEIWLNNHGFENNTETLRDGSGCGFEELGYGTILQTFSVTELKG